MFSRLRRTIMIRDFRQRHSKVRTTLDVYSHVTPGLQQAAALRFEESLAEVKTAALVMISGSIGTTIGTVGEMLRPQGCPGALFRA